MLKWFFFIAFIGCIANATNYSKKAPDEDEDEDYDTDYDVDSIIPSIQSLDIKTEVEEDWNKQERLWWLIAAIVSVVLFLWL